MEQTQIFYPMIALAALTFSVLLIVPIYRFKALFEKKVSKDDFKFGESSGVPDSVSIPNRNFMNLLELPILFYVVCISLFVTNTVDSTTLNLSWGYVALRVLHSFIHLTYNDVYHRVTIFASSVLLLNVIWIRFLMALL